MSQRNNKPGEHQLDPLPVGTALLPKPLSTAPGWVELGRAQGGELGVWPSREHWVPWLWCWPSLIPAPCPPQEQAIALTLLFSSFLLPTAWVLANIHHYRSRPE